MKMRKQFAAAAVVALLVLAGSLLAQMKHTFWMKGAIVDVQGKSVTLCLGSPDAAKTGEKLNVFRFSAAAGPKNAVKKTKIGTVKITEIFDGHMAKADVVSGTIKYGDLASVEGEE